MQEITQKYLSLNQTVTLGTTPRGPAFGRQRRYAPQTYRVANREHNNRLHPQSDYVFRYSTNLPMSQRLDNDVPSSKYIVP